MGVLEAHRARVDLSFAVNLRLLLLICVELVKVLESLFVFFLVSEVEEEVDRLLRAGQAHHLLEELALQM